MGVDIGTTSTKTVLYTKQGEVVSTNTINYPLHTPNPLVAEQNSDEIVNAVAGTIRETIKSISKDELAFVSFSAVMHCLIAVDRTGELFTNRKLRGTTLAFYLFIYSVSLIVQVIFAKKSRVRTISRTS
ncbi:hypothetical protein GCM10011409_14640 [Lentibacillus populi]|uniref:Carbohydrate kinase FGGY N-terminal domain-containing protein n=1 Tax=Lentibacillus populi TaxID=1827502 RepID=A0A9W5TXB4_9BACI|nr:MULTISPECIES: FGGY family carbohydrate kinase [Bacillaceae]MBT2217295.1 hypothetical protein [Virgibacillus dakarensis]GGB38226.1 hypothetical protein GCM10011409_14640 [Lentibacillus populi]